MRYNGKEIDELTLVGKTREELENILDHGSYSIIAEGERSFYVQTGKGGAIEYVLALTREIERHRDAT